MEPTSKQLMVEMGWVRRLARALVRDQAAAEDVAQETWLVAHLQQPGEERPLRPWLARVVRNLAHTRRRGEARREQREAAYDDSRKVATPADLVERVELQRVVAGEVLALAEPYRSTVLLHFVEGLTSAQIARRHGIPDGTVRRRLKAALDQLRAQLQARKDPPDRGWLAALVPLAQVAEPQPHTTVLGALAMKKLLALAVILVLVAAGALLWKWRGNAGPAAAPGTTAATSSAHVPRPVAGRHAIGAVPQWAAQADAPARRIAGHVVSDGAAVAGSTVRLNLRVGDELAQPLEEVTTGADGAFDFGMQPAATFAVLAQAEGHSAGIVTVANADPRAKPDQVLVELGDCRSRMYGSVSDASGGGIAKARLAIDSLSLAETDASGHYSVCLVAGVNFGTPSAAVRLEADGYGTTVQQVLFAGELRQDFVMVPEAALVGRVVTADDRPVAGARVIAQPDAIEGPHHVAANWTESDRDGRFRIAALSPGKFQLTASSRGFGTSVPMLAIARATTTSKELRLVVAPLARVSGRVVMNGAPVAGAHVSALSPSPTPGPQTGPTATSQADGKFTLDSVPLGTVKLAAAPFSVRTPKTLEIKTAQLDGVELEVGKLATVRGHVSRKGKPLGGVDISFAQPPQFQAVAKSEPDGAFVIEGVPAGDGQLVATSVQAKAWALPLTVHVTAGEDHAQDIVLDLAGEVQGTVVDEAGKPVPGVYVRMDLTEGGPDNCEAMADSNGAFDCAFLLGGEYVPQVQPSPGSHIGFAAATGDKLATITVPKDGVVTGVKLAVKNERLTIRGTVVDDTGAAVPDVHVEAIGPPSQATMDLTSAMSDANGKFEIQNLARGTYNVHAHAADGSETEVLHIAAGGDPIAITLARPGAIDGTLVGFSTTPIVETNTLTADLHIGGLAIVDGTTFSQVGLPPGRYTVQAKAGTETDGASVDVKSGETAHVTLKSRGTGRVEGTVFELGTKQPVVGMRCDGNLSMGGQMGPSPPDENHQAFTDAAGHFSVATPTGKIRIFCFNPSGGLLSVAGTDVDVIPGQVPHVDLQSVRATFGATPGNVGFDIRPLNLPLTVNVVDPAGPAASAGVAAGDHIVTIDGASLPGVLPQGASFLLQNHRAGTIVTLGLERAGAARTIKLYSK